MPHLLYIADPLCSWCYGFGPELSSLLERHPDARLDLVMGGLRPYNTEVMSPAFKEMLRTHWQHVAEASGLAFSESILERSDFIYDTEPACRAVVTARTLDASKAYEYLKAVQGAFYRDGREVTRPPVLADIAAECGYDRAAFLATLESPEMGEETRKDFSTTQSLGVNGFPTLAVAHGPQLYLVTSGYATADVLEERLAQIDRLAAAEGKSAAAGS
jgi:putative protein-disulfide isomerase